MRILQLCNKPPLPAKDGGCIAMNNITQGLLAKGHHVKLLTIYTHKHDFDLAALPSDYIDKTQIEGVFVDTRINAVDAFANFMTADSYNVSRFFSTDFDIKLTKTLTNEKFDIVHLESLFMTPYLGTIKRLSNAKVVLRSHNLEFVIWEKIAKGTRNVAKRTYLKYLSRKLKDYELSILGQVDGIAAISKEDKKRFRLLGSEKPIYTIPFGLTVDDYDVAETTTPEVALFHLGAMDWGPNLEGIMWFLETVWSKIHIKYPKLKFYVGGRNLPGEIKTMNYPNVIFVDEVEDAKQFMKSKAIMVVPLLSGGGIRVKIIEGLALGKAIISTTTGAEGIDCEHGKNILIADSPAKWLEAIDRLLKKPEMIFELGQQGRIHVTQNFDNAKIINKLIEFYNELTRK